MQQRFDALEGARAVLALWVFFGHALQNAVISADNIWPFNILAMPNYAVQTFMVVSGFAISHLVIQKQEAYPLYIARRWLRLFPLLAVAITTYIALSFVLPRAFVLNEYAPQYVIAYATMFHGAIPHEWLPKAATGILGPAWSISLEWQFYLVAPFIIGAFAGRRYFLCAALFALAVICSSQQWRLGDMTLSFRFGAFLPVSLIYFLVGVASYAILTRMRQRAIGVPLAILIVIAVFAVTGSYPMTVWAAIALAMFSSAELRAVLTTRPMLFLGKISYSIYLTHMMVMAPIRVYLIRPYIETGTLTFFLALTIPALILTIIVSMLTYRWVELPFIRWGKNNLGREVAAQPA